MSVFTINGTVGSGTFGLGQLISQKLDIDYVDRMVLAEAAKLVGSPVAALVEKEQRVVGFRERVSRFLQTMLERSALSGVAGEPYFGHSLEMVPAETYDELAGDASSSAQQVNDEAFIQATSLVIKDLAQAGNVVIIGRGSNMILRDTPGVFHVGLVAPLSLRVENIVNREHLSGEEAAKYVADLEQAREAFFRKFFKVPATDPTLYHVTINMGRLSQEAASALVLHAAQAAGV